MPNKALPRRPGLAPRRAPHYTYADYKKRELPDFEREELIRGTFYAMAAPSARHQAVLGELFRQLANFLVDKPCKVFPAPFDVRLFYKDDDESDDTAVQPDIVVVCDEEQLKHEGCRGAPSLVVEILSPSNSAVEMERKRRLYREAGVREYWVVNPDDDELYVDLFGENTAELRHYGADEIAPVTVLGGLGIDLKRVFAR
jgi:Uma2 family endonuclease